MVHNPTACRWSQCARGVSPEPESLPPARLFLNALYRCCQHTSMAVAGMPHAMATVSRGYPRTLVGPAFQPVKTGWKACPTVSGQVQVLLEFLLCGSGFCYVRILCTPDGAARGRANRERKNAFDNGWTIPILARLGATVGVSEARNPLWERWLEFAVGLSDPDCGCGVAHIRCARSGFSEPEDTAPPDDYHASVAQLVECVLGKDEVMGSSPIRSSVDKGGPHFVVGQCHSFGSRSSDGRSSLRWR